MSNNFIITEADKNLQFTEFNSELRPWRIYTTSIYHDYNLNTDTSYANSSSNNLYIESSGSDIKFLVDNDKKISFDGNTEFSNNSLFKYDVSFNKIVEISKHLNLIGDASFNNNVDISNHLNVNGDVSFNNKVDISNHLTLNGDVSFNNNIDISSLRLNNNFKFLNNVIYQDISFQEILAKLEILWTQSGNINW